MRTTLSDDQWQAVAPHWLGRECDHEPTGPDPRMFVEAVLWIARTGCQWLDLPKEFGKGNTVFKRFRRWVKADAFYRMFRVLAEDADFEYTMAPSRALTLHCRAMDGKIVKVHRSGQGAKVGLTVRPLAAFAAE